MSKKKKFNKTKGWSWKSLTFLKSMAKYLETVKIQWSSFLCSSEVCSSLFISRLVFRKISRDDALVIAVYKKIVFASKLQKEEIHTLRWWITTQISYFRLLFKYIGKRMHARHPQALDDSPMANKAKTLTQDKNVVLKYFSRNNHGSRYSNMFCIRTASYTTGQGEIVAFLVWT